MMDLTPRVPQRPLVWSEAVLNLRDYLHGSDATIYIVGGAVRDAYRHYPIKDIDLATPDNALALGRKIANLLQGDFFIMDAERDVSRVIASTSDGRLIIDIAHFRSNDLLGDLMDRDFTLNAIAVDLQGDIDKIIDPLNGEQDLLSKQIRRCTPHAISDDPLRALRAVRQSVQLGARIEPETLKDIRQYGLQIMDTSPERVRDELFKILNLAEPDKALRIADAIGLLYLIIPEIALLHELPQSPPHIYDVWRHTILVVEKMRGILKAISLERTDETAATFGLGMMVMALDRFRPHLLMHIQRVGVNDRSHVGLLILIALTHDIGKAEVICQNPNGEWEFPNHESVGAKLAEKRAIALRLSNEEKKRIHTVISNYSRPFSLPNLSNLELHRFWYQLGEYGVDVCLLAMADYLGTVGIEVQQDKWITQVQQIRKLLEAYYDRYDEIVAPPPLINGNHLMEILNLSPGPQIGRLLDLAREEQVIGNLHTTEDAIEFVKVHMNK